ncbi:restriction endonuclease subunit S [Acidobacteriota bacterium]
MGFESSDYSNELAVPMGWKVGRLGDNLITIVDYRGKTPKKAPTGIPCLTAANVKGGRIDLDGVNYISQATYDNVTTRGFPKPGDVLLTTEAPVGEVAPFPSKGTFHITRRVIGLRANGTSLCPRFLLYVLQTPSVTALLRSRTRGSTVERVLKEDITRLPLPLPALHEQEAISEVLGALDDKIALNQNINHILESIARVIFKSWFVDFDPVRAKMEGRKPFGMDAETAVHFPDSFDDSELGKIPQDWLVKPLGEVVAINERSINKDYPFQTIEYIDISSVKKGILHETRPYVVKESPSRAKRLVRHGDTIWSTVRPNRRSYFFVHSPKDNLVVSTGFAVLTPKVVSPSYLYAWVTTNDFVDYLTMNADGCAYPAVRPDRFAGSDILVPSRAVLEQFERIVSPMRDRIAANMRESEVLAAVRDTLLPKLIAGEIRIKDAEEVVEAST